LKILGAGRLRDRADRALQYALASPVLDCFTIGAESRRELEDLIDRIPRASVRG
jgi:1-deoxyxylulose-5-phosphate synthase